jgi:hypothetical protein
VRGLVITLIVWAAAGTSPARADSLRCGVHLVETGESAENVESRCGAPTRKAPLRGRRGRVFGEVWTYDRGGTEFVRFLVFIAGKLQSIETGGYGSSR